jgi:hypothetical protein
MNPTLDLIHIQHQGMSLLAHSSNCELLRLSLQSAFILSCHAGYVINASAKADETIAVCPRLGLEDANLFVAALNGTD